MSSIVFIDDAHTSGGAQVALCLAIGAILRRTNDCVVCMCGPRTRNLLQQMVGHHARLNVIECPQALPLNILSFPLRLPRFLWILVRLRRTGVRAWWLNLSGIEFCIAPLIVLRALGELPHAWLHNTQSTRYFTRTASWSRRCISRLRDGIADRWIFNLYPTLLTPSRASADDLASRLGGLKRTMIGHLYCPMVGEQSSGAEIFEGSDQQPESECISLWMIGRVDYGHKNNLAALDATDILRNMGKAVELVVVGDGPDLDHFKSTTVARGLDGIVTFLGWRDDPWKSVPSDAIVLIPSWYESLNLVAREAMSHGIRLAVSPLPVFHEWIPKQLIADDFSADAFAKAIIHVHGMRSSEMRQLYGKALRKFSDVNFVESFIAYSDER